MSTGVIISLCAITVSTFTNSLGLILMKQAIMKNEKLQKKYVFMMPRYAFGFFLLVMGAFILVGKLFCDMNKLKQCLIGGLSYADMITLSSTSSLMMVFNSFLSSRMLHEVFTKYDFFSMLLIAVGASLCVTFSNFENSSPSYDVNILFANYVLGAPVPISVVGQLHILRMHTSIRDSLSARGRGVSSINI